MKRTLVSIFYSMKLPKHSQCEQNFLMTLTPQQSPPSNWHSALLLMSSHKPSEIHTFRPPPFTEIVASSNSIMIFTRVIY